MKVTFEGKSFRELAEQAAEFFTLNRIESTIPITLGGPIKTDPHNLSEKRRPGRPPNPNSKKDKLRRLETNEPTSNKIMVGAVGVEPTTPRVTQVEDTLEPTQTHTEPTSHQHKIITKEDLVKQCEDLMKKENSGGIQTVRKIFEQFGVGKLGELNEKRYHELHKVLEAELAL
jgi:hypothetical protein